MPPVYRIHPAIGIARLGNSPDAFTITPETPGGLPIACDAQGNALRSPTSDAEQVDGTFKDAQHRIKRQAARFRIYTYDDAHPHGRELKVGDPVEGGGNTGTLTEIVWRVYLANKKSCWYEFKALQGEAGYAPDHPLRNADITDNAARERLIIDPGPVVVNTSDVRRAEMGRVRDDTYSVTFPPRGLQPADIDTLGTALTDDAGRLLVLGGFGNSGSFKKGFADPLITNYANNDGWFDDTADGAVMARLKFWVPEAQTYRYVDVEAPSWVIVSYPRYAPQLSDMITATDVLEDVFVRQFGSKPTIFGVPPFLPEQRVDADDAVALEAWRAQSLRWNRAYRPWFWRDIWPILKRPNAFNSVTNILSRSNYPHDQTNRGTFDPDKLGRTPKDGEDPYRPLRAFLYGTLRQPGEENLFNLFGRVQEPHRSSLIPLMPLLAGDNPMSNASPSKFLRLTDLQLFLLQQWRDGLFVNEKELGWLPEDATAWPATKDPLRPSGSELDHNVLANACGGAFFPGCEVTWIIRNPAIWAHPWRLRADPSTGWFNQPAANAYQYPSQDWGFLSSDALSLTDDLDTGLQPGDLTKRMPIPWQADFNECSTQTIDITYPQFNEVYPASLNDSQMARQSRTWETLWWPAHRPMQVYVAATVDGKATRPQLDWARGITQTVTGDLAMVTLWSELGFVVNNPDPNTAGDYPMIEVERSPHKHTDT